MPERQISINLADVQAHTHTKYGRLIQAIMQENAELQAGVEAMGPRIQELEQENDVLRKQLNQMSNPPDVPPPGAGRGLLSARGEALTGGVGLGIDGIPVTARE